MNDNKVVEKQIDKKNVVFYLPIEVSTDVFDCIDVACDLIKTT